MFSNVPQDGGSVTPPAPDAAVAGSRRGALTAPLTPAGLRGRRFLKRYLYAQMALRQAVMIAVGKEQPLVPFTVEADPPSVYVVFRLRPDVVDDLAADLGLPPGLPLTPMRCLADDAPAHLLTLNVYRVSGLANGLRAEWSLYVRDASGRGRYLVVDARSSAISMDPVDVITRASTVRHARDGRTVRTTVGDGESAVDLTIEVPTDDGTLVTPAPEWNSANDRIYWGNGICDRTYYDAGMADARVRRVPPASVVIDDRTAWAGLVEPEPQHVIVFEDAIELVISPWENIDDLRV